MIELILIAVGLVAGWYLREWWAMRAMKHIVNDAAEDFKETIRSKVIDAYVEKAGDEYFVYRKEDNSFLAQGKNINDLSDILQEKFPGKFFNIPTDQLEMLEGNK